MVDMTVEGALTEETSEPLTRAPDPTRLAAAWFGRATGTAALGGAAYLANRGNWREAVILAALSLTAFLLGPVERFFRQFTTKLAERMNVAADELAQRAVDELVRITQQVWNRLFSQTRSRYCRHLEYRFRTYRTQGLKTRGAFSPDLEKVYVPLGVSPCGPSRVSHNMVGRSSGRDAMQVWGFLADRSEPAYRRLAVLARPGAGKTTLLEHVTLIYARNLQRRFERRAPKLLPILLYLRDIREQVASDGAPSISLLMAQEVAKGGTPDLAAPLSAWLEAQLCKVKSNSCLVMLDGLDEVADAEQRLRVSEWAVAQMRRYPEVRFIVTSRPHGWLAAPVSEVRTVVEVEPFSLEDAKSFLKNWYRENESMRQQRRMDEGVRQEARRRALSLIAEIKRSPELSALCVNPLLLTMIATVHDNQGTLPKNRLGLYKEICEVLLERRQEEKGLRESLTSEQKHKLLRTLAMQLMLANSREFSLTQANAWLQRDLTLMECPGLTVGLFITRVAHTSGLLVEREQGEYEFCHKSLQEYLAAADVAATQKEDQRKKEDILVSRFGDPWWDETIRLYAAQVDSSGLLGAALVNPSVAKLALAYDCMREGLQVSVDIRRRLDATVVAALDSDDRAQAMLAAEVTLLRRSKSLFRLNDDVALDLGLVTNIEYQLFLDDVDQHASKSLAPDHWESARFPRSEAALPVVGLQPQAGEAFCDWLNQKQRQALVQHDRFRLPRLDEVMDAQASEEVALLAASSIGFWCDSHGCYQLHRLDAGNSQTQEGAGGSTSATPQIALSDVIRQACSDESPRDEIIPLRDWGMLQRAQIASGGHLPSVKLLSAILLTRLANFVQADTTTLLLMVAEEVLKVQSSKPEGCQELLGIRLHVGAVASDLALLRALAHQIHEAALPSEARVEGFRISGEVGSAMLSTDALKSALTLESSSDAADWPRIRSAVLALSVHTEAIRALASAIAEAEVVEHDRRGEPACGIGAHVDGAIHLALEAARSWTLEAACDLIAGATTTSVAHASGRIFVPQMKRRVQQAEIATARTLGPIHTRRREALIALARLHTQASIFAEHGHLPTMALLTAGLELSIAETRYLRELLNVPATAEIVLGAGGDQDGQGRALRRLLEARSARLHQLGGQLQSFVNPPGTKRVQWGALRIARERVAVHWE